MRLSAVTGTVLALLLSAGAASAAGGVGGKGDVGGKGGAGPGGAPSGSSAGASIPVAAGGGQSQTQSPDVTTNQPVAKKKPWEVGGTFETHRLIRQEDLGGAGGNKLLNVLGVFARWDITPNDRIGLRDYFYQRFIADQGETGLRTDDITLTYTRTQPLPKQWTFAATGLVSAPTSFSSKLQGLITAPALILQLDKKLGKYVSVSGRTVGGAFIVKYREAQGGAPNPKYRLSAALEAEVAMPFHEALSFGADVSTGYVWYYDVQNDGTSASVLQQNRNGGVPDPNYPSQPIQQSYGGEIFARYTLPALVGIKSDFTLALALGDPSLGYTSILHDGVGHTYLFYRQTSEVYGALSIRY